MRFDPEYVQSWYDEYGDQESQRWSKSPAFRMQYEIYVRHLRQRVRPGDRVLDCGCGPVEMAHRSRVGCKRRVAWRRHSYHCVGEGTCMILATVVELRGDAKGTRLYRKHSVR